MDKNNEFLGVLQHGVWLLSNICRDKPLNNMICTYKAIPVLCQLAEKLKGDSYLLTDISWAFLQLGMIYIKENDNSVENDEMIEYFFNSGIMKAINIMLK